MINHNMGRRAAESRGMSRHFTVPESGQLVHLLVHTLASYVQNVIPQNAFYNNISISYTSHSVYVHTMKESILCPTK